MINVTNPKWKWGKEQKNLLIELIEQNKGDKSFYVYPFTQS